jgi:hypothetical protein
MASLVLCLQTLALVLSKSAAQIRHPNSHPRQKVGQAHHCCIQREHAAQQSPSSGPTD